MTTLENMELLFDHRRAEFEERAIAVAEKYNYPIAITTAQRTIGPRADAIAPPHGTEVFVTNIPVQAFEDDLMPLFMRIAPIHKLRLMMSPSGLSNRGSAYVTYNSAEEAQEACEQLDGVEVAPGKRIDVRKSIDNRRIFIGGIPEDKTKDQMWHELRRLGMSSIVEVIMYKSYMDRSKNRGFVFVEFSTHTEAARARIDFKKAMLFGKRVQIDWADPLYDANAEVMKQVTILFVRNLDVLLTREELFAIVKLVMAEDGDSLTKVYKHRDYAFLHFQTRRDAQRALTLLKHYYRRTDVDVQWAKPPHTQQQQQQHQQQRRVLSDAGSCSPDLLCGSEGVDSVAPSTSPSSSCASSANGSSPEKPANGVVPKRKPNDIFSRAAEEDTLAQREYNRFNAGICERIERENRERHHQRRAAAAVTAHNLSAPLSLNIDAQEWSPQASGSGAINAQRMRNSIAASSVGRRASAGLLIVAADGNNNFGNRQQHPQQQQRAVEMVDGKEVFAFLDDPNALVLHDAVSLVDQNAMPIEYPYAARPMPHCPNCTCWMHSPSSQ